MRQRLEFFRSGGVPTRKEKMSSVGVFSFIAVSVRFSWLVFLLWPRPIGYIWYLSLFGDTEWF